MKSARITFRLQPYQLARALQTIRGLEPNYQLLSVNDMVKTIFHDYLTKMSLNRSGNVSQELIDEIVTSMNTNKTITTKTSLDDLIALKPKKEISLAPEHPKTTKQPTTYTELSPEQLAEIDTITNKQAANHLIEPSKFKDPNTSDAKISTVTDFSPPTDWIQGE